MSRRFSIFTVFILAAPALFAQSNGAPAIHVFGGWAYGKTNGNTYLAGTRDGAYDNATLALNVAASPVEQLRLEGQVCVGLDRGVRETSIDYAFAEWRLSDAARLRAGRLKHPFGIYTEIFDVGTLRPFYSLPQAVYGPVGTLAKAYDGVGISGFRKLGTRWAVTYDVYAGELELPFNDFEASSSADRTSLDVKRVVGGRAAFETPLDGLSFGASAYRGTISDEESTRHRAVGAQVEYLTERLTLRAELTDKRSGADTEHAGYLESAWHLTPHWQIAARRAALREQDNPSTTGRHDETVLGVNYWISRKFVLKISGHHVDGMHLVLPDAGAGKTNGRTNLLMFGAQFSF
jgi:hypothetical protein